MRRKELTRALSAGHAGRFCRGKPSALRHADAAEGNTLLRIRLAVGREQVREGVPSKRFAHYADDGVVKVLHMEAPGISRVISRGDAGGG